MVVTKMDKGHDQCPQESKFDTLLLDCIRWGIETTGTSSLNAKLINSSNGPKYRNPGEYLQHFLLSDCQQMVTTK
jgi:hypothetical protein